MRVISRSLQLNRQLQHCLKRGFSSVDPFAPRAKNPEVARQFRQQVEALKPGWGLPSTFHTHPEIFELELENIFYKDWLLVGHDCEIPNKGDFFTVQIGKYPLIIMRDSSMNIKAYHNVCRHRGSKIACPPSSSSSPQEGKGCEGGGGACGGGDIVRGKNTKHLVCPYHQWSYNIDGKLVFARDTNEGFDKNKNSLLTAHCRSTAGYIFVSVQEGEPLPFEGIDKMFSPFISPFNLKTAKIAHESRIIEKANWKIVWENNRECYHCRGTHPELGNTFPDVPSWVAGDASNKKAQIEFEKMLKVCKEQNLPTGFHVTADHQYRIMRIPLLKDKRSMTMTGEPAVKTKRLGSMPVTDNVGDILFYHYPNTWNHFTADHAISFRLLPISPTETELVTKWFVPGDAQEGVDYDLKTLTEVWEATNAQDKEIVERQFEGISSPAYQPADFNLMHEDAVSAYYQWYTTSLTNRLPK